MTTARLNSQMVRNEEIYVINNHSFVDSRLLYRKLTHPALASQGPWRVLFPQYFDLISSL